MCILLIFLLSDYYSLIRIRFSIHNLYSKIKFLSNMFVESLVAAFFCQFYYLDTAIVYTKGISHFLEM